MIDKLIEIGVSFKDCFTAEYMSSEMGIAEEKEKEYLQWLARLGVYCEAKLKEKYPEMTKQILAITSRKSKMSDNYNIIMGYLESAKELEN